MRFVERLREHGRVGHGGVRVQSRAVRLGHMFVVFGIRPDQQRRHDQTLAREFDLGQPQAVARAHGADGSEVRAAGCAADEEPASRVGAQRVARVAGRPLHRELGVVETLAPRHPGEPHAAVLEAGNDDVDAPSDDRPAPEVFGVRVAAAPEPAVEVAHDRRQRIRGTAGRRRGRRRPVHAKPVPVAGDFGEFDRRVGHLDAPGERVERRLRQERAVVVAEVAQDGAGFL